MPEGYRAPLKCVFCSNTALQLVSAAHILACMLCRTGTYQCRGRRTRRSDRCSTVLRLVLKQNPSFLEAPYIEY